jgi:hypothetical protein
MLSSFTTLLYHNYDKAMIQIIDTNSGQCLKTFPLDQSELAYQEAAQLDLMGLSVKIIYPGTAITLAQSLGKNSQEINVLKEELNDEIDFHDQGCCLSSDPKTES